jgi:hypothetical protein
MALEDDPREEIKRELELLVALGLVTVNGMTDDGEWLYSVTEKALKMSDEERWDAIFGQIVELRRDYRKDQDG